MTTNKTIDLQIYVFAVTNKNVKINIKLYQVSDV